MLIILWLFICEVAISVYAYCEGVPKGYYSYAEVLIGNIICITCLILLSIIVSSHSKEDSSM